MVEKHTDFEIQCDAPEGKTYVLATDYAALEAERDEWKRRCEKIVKMLEVPPNATVDEFHAYCEECWWRGFPNCVGSGEDFEALCPECECGVEEITESFTRERAIHARAVAVAEGRDNA